MRYEPRAGFGRRAIGRRAIVVALDPHTLAPLMSELTCLYAPIALKRFADAQISIA